ncbi:MAG: hypothetical protein HZB91_10300 [Elusimicrobia bacterium]|nr:hypothetical protein [Elusimicrobiota bacterium]
MTYQIRRINPYWHSNPLLLGAIALGVIVGVIGIRIEASFMRGLVVALGCLMAGSSVLAMARPVLSAFFATLGLIGGLFVFLRPGSPYAASMVLWQKFLSTALFVFFYTILWDSLALVAVALYNFFSDTVGLGGVKLDLESDETSGEAG